MASPKCLKIQKHVFEYNFFYDYLINSPPMQVLCQQMRGGAVCADTADVGGGSKIGKPYWRNT